MRVSYSQIGTYQRCPRRYRYQYIDKIPDTDDTPSPALVLGSAVHRALEMLYDARVSFHDITIEQLQRWYRDARDQELDKRGGTSVITPSQQQQRDDHYHRGIVYVERYFDRYAPFDSHQMVANEGNVGFYIGQDYFSGKVDRVDMEGDRTFVIHDYKTNKSLPTGTDHRTQLTLYAVAITQKYGKYFDRLLCRLHYLHFDTIDEREVTQADQDAIVQEYSAHIQEISRAIFAHNMGDMDAFPAVENYGCNYCPYKSICPLRSHAAADDEHITTSLGETTIKKLVDEYAHRSATERDAKKQKDAIKPYLIDYAARNDLGKLFGKESQIALSTRTLYKVTDEESCADILRRLSCYDDAIKIDTYKIAALIKDGTLRASDLTGAIEASRSVTLRAGKKKG